MKKKVLAGVLALAMTALMAGGCSGGTSQGTASTGQSSSSGQAQSKTLTAYTAYQENEASGIFKEFEKETGIKVNFVRLSAGELYARIQAEKENPQASLWFGTSVDTLDVAAKAGYISAYTSSEANNIPENLRDSNGYWTPHSVSVLCFATNEEWLKENNLEAPTTWNDLLDSKYKGNVVVAHPGTSGTAFTWLVSMVQLMGEDDAFSYLKKLNSNITQYTKGGAAPATMVGLGEAKVGICYSCDAQNAVKSGYKIKITYPTDGTGYEVTGMALIKGGPSSEVQNAKKFIDWSTGKEAQEYFVENFGRLPVNQTASVPEGITAFSDIKKVNEDTSWGSSNRDRLIKKFESDVHGQKNLRT